MDRHRTRQAVGGAAVAPRRAMCRPARFAAPRFTKETPRAKPSTRRPPRRPRLTAVGARPGGVGDASQARRRARDRDRRAVEAPPENAAVTQTPPYDAVPHSLRELASGQSAQSPEMPRPGDRRNHSSSVSSGAIVQVGGDRAADEAEVPRLEAEPGRLLFVLRIAEDEAVAPGVRGGPVDGGVGREAEVDGQARFVLAVSGARRAPGLGRAQAVPERRLLLVGSIGAADRDRERRRRRRRSMRAASAGCAWARRRNVPSAAGRADASTATRSVSTVWAQETRQRAGSSHGSGVEAGYVGAPASAPLRAPGGAHQRDGGAETTRRRASLRASSRRTS